MSDVERAADTDMGEWPCGTTRPGTLGYQHCVLLKGHAGLHRSQDGQSYTVDELV